MNAIATAAAALAGKELFKKVLTDIYDYCLKETGLKLKQWSTERQIDTLYRRISQVRKVKTIWQVDKAVDLVAFYCDSHVVIDNKRKKIAQLSDFGMKDNILIQGIAGQGKSIFLRYLCANELGRGQYIPLFIELRRISKEASLMNRIETSFSSLGLSVDQSLFESLASTGKLLLLLDAFDEIPDELKTTVLTDIEDLAARYDKLRIIVTSRPYHNIQVSNHFTVVTLDNLHGTEYAQVIYKLAVGQQWAQGLIDHIEKRATHIKELLCTPLMVTLLVLSYKSYQKLPATLSDFYDALFQTLLQRHDGTKPGFTRQRGCALDDNEYRQVFETLCILAKKTGQQSLSSRAIYDLAKESLAQYNYKANSKSYVDDIVKITCLIIRDGEEHRFIHKTVQEYYTASYIQKKPSKWVSDFYGRVLKANAFREWHQELEFLAEIDSYRYNRFYLFPALLDLFNISETALEGEICPVSNDFIFSLFDRLAFSWANRTPHQLMYRLSGPGPDLGFLHEKILSNTIRNFSPNQSMVQSLSNSFPELISEKQPHGPGHSLRPMNTFVIGEAFRRGALPSLLETAKNECSKLIEKVRSLHKTLKEEENSSLLDGLI